MASGDNVISGSGTLDLTGTGLNAAPTLIAFNEVVASTDEDNTVAITFTDLLSNGDATDGDGSVDSFVITSVTSGTLAIGVDASSATAYDLLTNNIVDSAHQAYWTPAANQNGTLNAFAVVARDNSGAESLTAILASVSVTPVNDDPVGEVMVSSGWDDMTLYAENTLEDADELGNISYQWLVDGAIVSFDSYFTPGSSEIGKMLSVTASYIDGGGTVESVSSWPILVEKYGHDYGISLLIPDNSRTHFTEQTPVAVSSGMTVYDTDGNGEWNGGELRVRITANAESDDSLSLPTVNLGGIGIWLDTTSNVLYAGDYAFGVANASSVNNGDALTFFFFGTVPNALVLEVVRAITFNNSSDAPGIADRTVSFSADWWNTGATAEQTVTITPVNDAPVITHFNELSFASRVDYGTGSHPRFITSTDVNGDGKADLIVANTGSNTLSVLSNNGDGTFADKIDYATGSAPVSIARTDVNGDGNVDLIVANQWSDNVSVLTNNGDGTFADKINYATGSVPSSVVSVDVNGDGNVDLVVANAWSNTVSVLTNSGNGTFAGKIDYATAWNPGSITSADVNGDGKADLIVANAGSNTVSVLRNNGDGTFADKVDYTTGSDPSSVNSADVNSDGKVDLIVTNYYSDTVSILTNNGDGTFAAKIDYDTGSHPVAVTSADVNGDGKADLIVTNFYTDTASVLSNNGDGTFADKVDYSTGSLPYSVTSTDVNGDGNADLIVANADSDTVSVLRNTSWITPFTEQTPVAVSGGMVVYDPDGDGEWNGGSLQVQITTHAEAADSLSLQTVNPGGNGIWLDTAGNKLMAGDTAIGTANASAVSNGDAWSFSFNANATNALVQEVARAITFNNSSDAPGIGDRAVIFMVTDNNGASTSIEHSISITPVNDAPAFTGFTGTVAVTDEDTLVTITFADLLSNGDAADADGTVEAFVIKSVTSGMLKIGADVASATAYDAVTNNTVDATHQAYWTPEANQNSTLDAFSLVARDNSGAESLTAIQASVSVMPINDAPVITQVSSVGLSFADKVDYAVGDAPWSVTSADINSDGKVDLIAANYGSNTVSVLTNHGDGTFSRVDYDAGSRPESVTTVDVNGDGKVELIVANANSDTVSVLGNNGNGTFSAKIDYATGSSPASVTNSDVNGDGKADLIVANYGSKTISVLLNNGDGTFADKVDYNTGDGSHSVASADVNSDGMADLIVVNHIGCSVSVLTNLGDGTFAAKVDYDIGWHSGYEFGFFPIDVTITDVNGDGKADVILADAAVSCVSVLINHGDGTFDGEVWGDPLSDPWFFMFADKVDYVTGSYPISVTNSDVNGDGKVDLIVANQWSDTASVLTNYGNGTFADKVDYATGFNPTSVTSADVNGDGKADLIVANAWSDTVSVLTNTSTFIDASTTTSFIEQTPIIVSSGIIVYDPDGDGDWNGGALQVQITANAEGADSLNLQTVNPGGSGIWLDIAGNILMAGDTAIGTANASTVSNGDAWSFSFNANATNALVQEAARAITFNNSSDAPGIADRMVSFTVTDNNGASANTVQTVTITPINDAPTLTSFNGTVVTTSEHTQVAITLANLQAKGNEADVDGTVNAFVIKSVTSGTLKIGIDTASATAYDAGTNNTVDTTHQAYWTPAINQNGVLDAFTVVARDNNGAESVTAVQATVMVASVIKGTIGNDVLIGTPGYDLLYGLGGNDILIGNAGNDTLNGGAGNDILLGGTGNDVYYVDSVGDVIVELTDEGTDRVYSSLSYVLGDNLENLSLLGTGNIDGTGKSSNNSITGNSGNNVLIGLDGNDTLNGGAGNDLLLGGTGNDILLGGLGDDTMTGGIGNDAYYVDSLGDVVIELTDEGTDRVYSSLSYVLGENLEHLSLLGTLNIDGTGNSANNSITGNIGDNVLGGLEGNDTLNGLAGNDLLLGDTGNDVLNGGAGDDTMTGGIGNDVYYVDSVGDVVVENADAGTDRVYSSLSYVLGENLEHLLLLGTGNIDGTGNSNNNSISGNSGDNVLSGLDGNDTLNGGSGNDSLFGGLGNDTLIGGAGSDMLTGGSGNDLFRYSNESESGITAGTMDVNSDFTPGQDRVDLSGIDANTAVSGNQAFSSVILGGTDPFTVAGQLRFDSADGVLYGNTDSDPDAEFAIQLSGVATLTASNIIL
jgi:Ca2+-binding RTX toxin-like protein